MNTDSFPIIFKVRNYLNLDSVHEAQDVIRHIGGNIK